MIKYEVSYQCMSYGFEPCRGSVKKIKPAKVAMAAPKTAKVSLLAFETALSIQ